MNIGNVLQRPRQPDTYSCAICTMSTIGHGIFGDPLWTHQDASVHRIRWLLTLSENEGISIPRDPVSRRDCFKHVWCTYICCDIGT